MIDLNFCQSVFDEFFGFGEFGFGSFASEHRGFNFCSQLFLPYEVYLAGCGARHIDQHIFQVAGIQIKRTCSTFEGIALNQSKRRIKKQCYAK